MDIEFRYSWGKGDEPLAKRFRLPGAAAAAGEYLSRINRYCPCRALGPADPEEARKAGSKLWLLDREGPRAFSSEELAGQLNQTLSGGISRLLIVVGGADGFDKEAVGKLAPDLRWSLGPITLPHELAAVVAAEQLYRAWTILRQEPYHLGH